MKYLLLLSIVIMCFSGALFAQQKDTVYVPGFYESGGVSPDDYGTLNNAVDAARTAGTINNTVFKLTPYDVYVITKTLFLGIGENLEIVAPKPLRAGDADAETVQNSAPPQIVWDESVPAPDADDYIIKTYGNLVLKNVWVRYADFLGTQRSSSITFIDTVAQGVIDTERGQFEGCLFDFCPIGTEAGGAITVDADHFTGIFKDCYFRNLSDNHFQYYGRAVSFPYQSTGFHYDSLLFENSTFSNLSRIVMQEGNEYGDNVLINHCTLINSIEWVYQSAGWLNRTAITNSIFINPYLMGYRPVDVCPDSANGQALTSDEVMDLFNSGQCNEPGGGLINGITQVDSFGFTVPFTDLDRGLYIAHDVYMYQDWMLNWFKNCPTAKDSLHKNRLDAEIRLPSPMIGGGAWSFIDSMDSQGKKVFTKFNVDTATIYSDDPNFVVAPTNEDTLKIFIEGKWYLGTDIPWSYQPYAGFAQQWPLPENLAYTNTTYQTAAMGNFPLGDLNWFPDKMAAWKAQRDAEWAKINDMLDIGITAINKIPGKIPGKYVLSQNYPNPFNPVTVIKYSIPLAGKVSLKVFNTLGQEVATLFDGNQKAGKYQAIFNGSRLSSGVYFYRLESGNSVITKKFVLTK